MTADQPPFTRPNPSPRPAARDTLHAELPCRRCGYLLTGLTVRANCPECGLPVAFSLHGDYLKYSNPRWLGMLALGSLLLFAGLVSTVGLLLASFVLSSGVAGHRFARFGAWTNLALLASQLVALVGNFLLTRREPVRFNQQQLRLGLITRGVRAADVACILVLWLTPQVYIARLPEILQIALRFSVLAGWTTAQVLEIAVIRRLLRRMPNYTLVRWADVLIHGLTILYGLCLGLMLLVSLLLLATPVPNNDIGSALSCAVTILGFSAAVFQLLGIPFLVQAARALLRERRFAAAPPEMPRK